MASCVNQAFPEAEGLRCPICLNMYTAPKNLPCRHTCCQYCLHKHIMKNVLEEKQIATFHCPVCQKETFPPLPDIPVDKWAEYFPYNIVLLSVLPSEKNEVAKNCDSCLHKGTLVTDARYCTVCKEVFCLTCGKKHYKNNETIDHAVVRIDDLIRDIELVVSLLVSVTSFEHVGKEFEFDTTVDKTYTDEMRPSLKDRKPEIIAQFDAEYFHGKNPLYSGIISLPDDRIVLVDYENNTCRLYSSSYNHIADHKLTSSPRAVCVVGESEVAVTLPWENMIQLLNVNDFLQPEMRFKTTLQRRGIKGTIKTSLQCDGIAALSRHELVVSGTMNDGVYWCIVCTDGSEKTPVKVCDSAWYSCMAVNNRKTCIYVSHYSPSVVYAYRLNGSLIFRYEHKELDGASGLAVDREDNLYVVGEFSNTVHQVSLDGTSLQVFSTQIPKNPCAICFTSSSDEFLLTSGHVRKVHKMKFK
ncbi:hypothetical protein CHS0354_001689 [Potamilus streckersoni]|uniref:RING-type domain-containing protein n=1 Tax=Potamilus streckersoni TaxID=2493646 RepID=A0AAE0VLG4_9BIVA|nr:hypothetical protein CHS0354_001689 [Potamilus streckersoni]